MATCGPYFCKICQIPTNGPEPFKQHNESAKHLKKASFGPSFLGSSSLATSDFTLTSAEVAMIGNLTRSPPSWDATSLYASASPSLTTSPSGLQSSYFCSICSVPFNGHEPYKQHMSSPKHKKKVDGQRLIGGVAPTPSSVPIQSPFTCTTGARNSVVSVDSANLSLQNQALRDVLIIPTNEKIRAYLPQLGF